jgi:hypothetical protein
MNKTLRFFAPLVGLALLVAGTGCGRSVRSRDTSGGGVQPGAATSIKVTITAPSGGSASDIQGLRVLVLVPGSIVRDTTLASVSVTPYSFNITGLAGLGTYQVAILKIGFTVQAKIVSITGSGIPAVSFGLKAIVNSSTIEVVNTTITDPTRATTITVLEPPVVRNNLTNSAPATVIIPAGSGLTNVLVSTMTAAEVPAIITNNAVTQSVLSGVLIQTNATTTSPIVVKFPIPIGSAQFAQAAGGTVDVYRFNTSTMTWELLGQATIGADGTASYSLAGLTDTNTLLSIGSTPTITRSLTAVSTSTFLTADQISRMLLSGQSTASYDLNPSWSLSKPTRDGESASAAKPGIVPPPVAGLDPVYWQMIAPIIAAQRPELAQYIYDGTTNKLVDLPTFVGAILQTVRARGSWQFTYRFGGVSKLIKIVITFDHVNIICTGTDCPHESGLGF